VGRYLRELDLGGAKASDAARRWSLYEMAAISLGEGASTSNLAGSLDGDVIGRVRVQTHYLANHCFLRPDELLARIDSITHLPAEIVQGTLDMVCPAGTANHVASKLPRSRLTLVHGAGHSATQPALAAQLVAATDRFRDIIE
jgi:proline iminopeptidase